MSESAVMAKLGLIGRRCLEILGGADNQAVAFFLLHGGAVVGMAVFSCSRMRVRTTFRESEDLRGLAACRKGFSASMRRFWVSNRIE
ncbi:MAG: hypothetical protein IPK53_19560 [bacterium]|nr:hypothetical protein [bacterium]